MPYSRPDKTSPGLCQCRGFATPPDLCLKSVRFLEGVPVELAESPIKPFVGLANEGVVLTVTSPSNTREGCASSRCSSIVRSI